MIPVMEIMPVSVSGSAQYVGEPERSAPGMDTRPKAGINTEPARTLKATL